MILQRILTFLIVECGLPVLMAWFILAVDPEVRKASRDFKKATRDYQKWSKEANLYGMMNDLLDQVAESENKRNRAEAVNRVKSTEAAIARKENLSN